MSVGAGIDFSLFAAHPLLIPALVIGLMVLKWLVLMGLGFVIRLSPNQRWTFALALAQGGSSPSCCSRSPPRTRYCRAAPSHC